MPVSDRDRNRLAALVAIVKPANSLAARLDAITDEQRAYYATWEARYERWIEWCKAQHDDEIEVDARPYARMLEHDTSPRLHRDVEAALFDETPKILLSDTEETAARKWMDQLQCT
ncbi:hypothetical protein J6500_00265 [Bradyrhizobium sp. WSM 1704]|uniref:hypothetical protein n=1 Tax=Bradyrhizobium semiaridum TaxID=2821404 RepID=UPI001CE29E4E|nr:hypothetical protein [Bradyrhizobium semiaridum]MCA6120343.1 hypothetical protein [Bradyrhizobium semiaridum]